MSYRVATLRAILMMVIGFTLPAYAGQESFLDSVPDTVIHNAPTASWIFKGTCNGSIAGGLQTTMERVRAAHLVPDSNGFVWKAHPFECNSVTLALMNDHGDIKITFSNGDATSLGFEGVITTGGPQFFTDTVYLPDGTSLKILDNGPFGLPADMGDYGEPLPSALTAGWQQCQFFFADHGTFTQGWQSRLAKIECDLRVKIDITHIVNANVTFDVSQPPPVP